VIQQDNLLQVREDYEALLQSLVDLRYERFPACESILEKGV
jgi:hypothetical protein